MAADGSHGVPRAEYRFASVMSASMLALFHEEVHAERGRWGEVSFFVDVVQNFMKVQDMRPGALGFLLQKKGVIERERQVEGWMQQWAIHKDADPFERYGREVAPRMRERIIAVLAAEAAIALEPQKSVIFRAAA